MKKLGRPLAASGNVEGAIQLLEAHAEAHRDDAADALTYAGELAFDVNTAPAPPSPGPAMLVFQGDHARAEALFRRALKHTPGHWRALYGLARALPQASMERIDVLTAATAAHPTYLGLLDLGDSLRSIAKNYEGAHSAYSRAHELDPRQRTTYTKLADICKKLDRPEEAAEWRARWQRIREAGKPSIEPGAVEVEVNEVGWTRCPACNRRFSVDNTHAFSGGRHRSGQALTLRPVA